MIIVTIKMVEITIKNNSNNDNYITYYIVQAKNLKVHSFKNPNFNMPGIRSSKKMKIVILILNC